METTATSTSQRGSSASKGSSKRKRDTSHKTSTPSKRASTPRRSALQTSTINSAGQLRLDDTQDQSPSTSQQPSTGFTIDPAATAAAALKNYSSKSHSQRNNSSSNRPTSEASDSDEDADPNDALQNLEGSSGAPNAEHQASVETESSPEPPTPPHNLYSRHLGGPIKPKPPVGSKLYEAQRKANHKEVERRRRETINEGINELAKMVPGCEKSKGHILLKAAAYIQKLQDESNTNIDKWTFEKLITEQAISEMSSKLGQAWQEKNVWKEKAKEAGVDVAAVEAEMRKGINKVLSDEQENRKGEPTKEDEARAKMERNGTLSEKAKAATVEDEESESEGEDEE